MGMESLSNNDASCLWLNLLDSLVGKTLWWVFILPPAFPSGPDIKVPVLVDGRKMWLYMGLFVSLLTSFLLHHFLVWPC